MKGVFLTTAKVVSEDDRRKIIEIQNGQMSVRNMKILIVKKGEALLGNHYHPHYSELMYMFKGSARYRMRNIDTKEVEDYNLVEGDLIFRTSRISHAGFFSEDSIVIDGAEEPYISQDFNDVKDVILGNWQPLGDLREIREMGRDVKYLHSDCDSTCSKSSCSGLHPKIVIE